MYLWWPFMGRPQSRQWGSFLGDPCLASRRSRRTGRPGDCGAICEGWLVLPLSDSNPPSEMLLASELLMVDVDRMRRELR